MAYEVTTAAASLEFDTRDGLYNSCAQIDSNHFINFWQGGTGPVPFAQVIAVNTSTWAVTTAAASLTYDAGGTYNSCVQIDTNHFINFWRTSTTEGVVQVFTVNTTTWAVTTAAASLTYDANVGGHQSAVKVDTNHFLVFFQSASADGFAQVIAVNTTTWAVTTAAASLEFDTQNSSYNSCCAIDTNHFINFWLGGATTTDGFAQVFTVNTTTWAVTTAAASKLFDTDVGSYNSCFMVDSTHFINFWQGVAGDGFAQIFAVDTSTWAITTAGSPLEFDTADAAYNSCAKVDTNHFILFWAGPGTDGFVQVFAVNTSTWAITTTAASLEFDAVNGTYHSCFRIDGAHFIDFWAGSGNDGFVQVLTVAVQQVISLSETATIVGSVKKTPGKNISQAVTITGAVATARTLTKALTQQIVIVASMVKTPGKSFTQAIVIVSGLFKTIGKNVTQAITITGIVAKVKGAAITLVQGITVTGSVVTSIVRNIILTENIVINAAVTFLKKARGFILGRNTDTNIVYGKKKNLLGRNNDTNIMYGKKLK